MSSFVIHIRPIFFVFALGLFGSLNSNAQSDSVSHLTITEYRKDTVFSRDFITKYFYQNNLVLELRKVAVFLDESNLELTTNYYDLEGNLVKSVRIEEDRYPCEPVWKDPNEFQTINLQATPYFPLSSEDSISLAIIPDSNETVSRFCGFNLTKVTEYLPYMEITNIRSHYNEDEVGHSLDTVFTNRYGDITRKVTYGNDKLNLEYRYSYIRDAQGRIIEMRWDNLTLGAEFTTRSKYIYDGDRKIQVYHSYHHFNKQEKESYSKTYFDENFEIKRHENYYGDSLESSYDYFHTKESYKYIGTNGNGDTVNISEFIRRPRKNGKQSWSRQTIRSSEYQYSKIDKIRTRKGFRVESYRYRISKDQFTARADKMTKRNKLLSKEVQYFDKLGRLIKEIEFDTDLGTLEFRYEYGVIH